MKALADLWNEPIRKCSRFEILCEFAYKIPGPKKLFAFEVECSLDACNCVKLGEITEDDEGSVNERPEDQKDTKGSWTDSGRVCREVGSVLRDGEQA